jgi:3-hydroxyisobutyrate dehydrogenase
MSTIPTIGFIGLGSMGGDQARELAKLPNPLVVFDTFPAAMEKFAGRAHLAASIAALGAQADIVGICVRDDDQVNACVTDLLPTLKPGAVILIHSTIRPATAIALAARAAETGVKLLDAPVSRTEMTKDGPFVYCMTGGDEALATELQPILAAFATNTIHVGPLGSAMALKICNNIASWCQIMLGLEIADIATAAGVSLDKLLTVMTRNGVMSPPMQGFMQWSRNPGPQATRDFFASQAGIGDKDLHLAEQLAAESATPTPVTSYIRTLVKPGILAVCNRPA